MGGLKIMIHSKDQLTLPPCRPALYSNVVVTGGNTLLQVHYVLILKILLKHCTSINVMNCGLKEY